MAFQTRSVSAVDRKSNEIIAIPLLLGRLELSGALVTIDAMGCQREIAEKIREKGADYLLALKDNWPTLAEDVRLYFEREPQAVFDTHETTDGDHGRIEVRRRYVSQNVDWLSTHRRFPGEQRFPALAMIGMIEATVERDGKTSVSRRYYLSSAPLSAEQFAHAARAHWGVENRLHWVLDVVFHDDLMRLRTANGPANMATIKHAALNLVKEIPDKASFKIRKKTVAWDDDYLFAALTQPWR
jgi:predicted transposase YbfD/YdcC